MLSVIGVLSFFKHLLIFNCVFSNVPGSRSTTQIEIHLGFALTGNRLSHGWRIEGGRSIIGKKS